MLETKELIKIYKPKKGVPVMALNKVSLKFPNKGMVFLLGKSGSGKSTLLNVLGGLDIYNSGEIIIKGVSSKSFKQKHFDSYRNTYVGFIFQEYNVLEEFTVGANIALALQLQNRKATDTEINRILKQVDLEGYGNRKPNELSGGQKQRVAIARALIKNPEIIMADEPSGALDSNTGKQIFETLKKLSNEKLVIVVSHDREFAEQYADRIIELADGQVISDVELDNNFLETMNDSIVFNKNNVEIPCGYHLTEQDLLAINDYIDKLNSSLSITVATKRAGKRFIKTDQTKIIPKPNETFKLIKSKLPLKNAFKIGANGLKYKKFRLVMTILLSCISFGLFGLADTFASYNHIETCTNSLYDNDISYLAISKSKKIEKYDYWKNYGFKLSEKDLSDFKENTGTQVYGIYLPREDNITIDRNVGEIDDINKNFEIYSTRMTGFGAINNNIINELGFKLLAGKLPDGNKNEVAISEYIFEVFKKAKYIKTDDNGFTSDKPQEILKYSDILGKTLFVANENYTITAVVDTNLELDRYKSLIESDENLTNAQELINMILYSEFESARSYSYAGVIMVGDGYVEKLIKNRVPGMPVVNGNIDFYNDELSLYSEFLATLSEIDQKDIVWVNGKKTVLAENEIIITTDIVGLNKEEAITDYKEYFSTMKDLTCWQYLDNEDEPQETKVKIVGFIPNQTETDFTNTIICSDSLYERFVDDSNAIYRFAVGNKLTDKEKLRDLVSYCYREDSTQRTQINNSITFELDSINEGLKVLSNVFLYIGLGFAVFAGLMLANFIAMSISYKKQEIGILRAIGSRSNDVFRIFFCESFIIAIINFCLSTVGVFIVTNIINLNLKNGIGILITVLTFSSRQIILLFAVSILVAFVASFFPVRKIASKRPIDAIRNR